MNRNFRQNTRSGKFCPICRDAGRDGHAHALRINGVLTCPYLRAIVCSECGCTGDDAHTLSHCPVYKQRMAREKAQHKADEKESFRERQNKRTLMGTTNVVPDSAKVFPQQPFSTLTIGNVRTLAYRCELGLNGVSGILQDFYDNYQNRITEMTATWNKIAATPVKTTSVKIEESTPKEPKVKKLVILSAKKTDVFAREKQVMNSWADSDTDDEMDFNEELVWECEIPKGVSDSIVA